MIPAEIAEQLREDAGLLARYPTRATADAMAARLRLLADEVDIIDRQDRRPPLEGVTNRHTGRTTYGRVSYNIDLDEARAATGGRIGDNRFVTPEQLRQQIAAAFLIPPGFLIPPEIQDEIARLALARHHPVKVPRVFGPLRYGLALAWTALQLERAADWLEAHAFREVALDADFGEGGDR